MIVAAGADSFGANAFSDKDGKPLKPIGLYAIALSFAAGLSAGLALLASLFSFETPSDVVAFLVVAIVLGPAAAWTLRRPFERGQLRPATTMSAVVLSFLFVAVVSTFLYVLTGTLTRVDDALYESLAGVSTSALTIFDDPSELSNGVLVWRSGTQWLGGLAALVFAAGLLPFIGGSRELMGGPQTRRRTPSQFGARPTTVIRRASRIYFTVTVVVAIAFIIAGMGARDGLIHALSTVSTGGFSTHADSFGHFDSAAIEIVAIVAMLGAASSAAFAWTVWSRAFADTRRAFELQVFLLVITASTLWVWWLRDDASSMWQGLRESLFTVVSLASTTGHRLGDWGSWHPGAATHLLLLLVIGGTAGSVAGGLRWIRVIGMAQFVWRELQRQLHPRSIRSVKVGRSTISEATVDRMHAQMVYVMALGAIASLVLALFGEGITEAITLTMSAISTAGPGFDDNGGIVTAASLTRPERAVLMPVMLTGRLFIFPAFVAVGAAGTRIAQAAQGHLPGRDSLGRVRSGR